MTITRSILLAVAMMVLLPCSASAQDKTYFGVSMFNSNYQDTSHNHRSVGLMGRLGYDLSKHFAVETHFGGSIGPENKADIKVGQAQISSLYGGFLRINSQFNNKRVYALAGITYGSRMIKRPNSSAAIKNSDSNKSFGLGVELYGNQDISFDVEWVRYFDNRYFSVDAFNLGLMTRF